MKRINIIEPKPIRHIFDSDWDGVPNDEDCVWYDPNRQGYKSMKWRSLKWRRELMKEKKKKKQLMYVAVPSYSRAEIIWKP